MKKLLDSASPPGEFLELLIEKMSELETLLAVSEIILRKTKPPYHRQKTKHEHLSMRQVPTSNQR